MANFYRITNLIDYGDLFTKINNAFIDVGFSSSNSGAQINVTVNPTSGDVLQIKLGADNDLYLNAHHAIGGYPSWSNVNRQVMLLKSTISEVHILGWDSPKAVLIAIRRTDEVWLFIYVGDLDNIGGNNQGTIVSYSNQFFDGDLVGSDKVYPTKFPYVDEIGEPYQSQRPLFGWLHSSWNSSWGTVVSCEVGQSASNSSRWLRPTDADRTGFIIPMITTAWDYYWGSNLGWRKLQAINPDYNFTSQLLPIEVYNFTLPAYFYPLGNVAHARATKRSGINALDRLTVGNEEYLMFPMSRVGVREKGIGSGDHMYAFKLTTEQLTPVSI